MDIWLSFLTGAAGAAVCSGIFSVVQMLLRRRWEKSDKGSAANNKRIANYNGSATKWWLRSPLTNNTSNVWGVDSNGEYSVWGYYNTCGVRPAFAMPPDLLVDDNNNIF